MPHVVSFLVTLIAFLGTRNITRGGAMAAADDIAIRFTFFTRKKTDLWNIWSNWLYVLVCSYL